MTKLLIHRSERGDPLVDALGGVLQQAGADPFTPEVVAVPSRGVERWLAQRLSHVLGAVDGDGVCANVEFPSSNAILDDALAAAHSAYADAVDRWAPSRAVWPLMVITDEAVRDEPWAAGLGAHLAAGRSRRFLVNSKLARHFARYAGSRPAMIRAWAAGRYEDGLGGQLPSDVEWQARLWRRLHDTLGPSPAELLDDACAALRRNPDRVDLPDRLSIFGVTRMSPTRIAAMAALAESRELHLWLHHPSPALWAEVAARRPQAGSRAGAATLSDIANPLLTSLSRDVRELQILLADLDAPDVHHAVPPRTDTVLGRLQRELADDLVPAAPTPAAADDRSLTVHACHGPARQIEVVREVILGLLRDDPTLEPRDILVMCPNVEVFAPLVAASFGMTDEPDGHPAAQLRVRLADRSLQQTNPLLGLLAQLLELGAHRVTASELLDLAQSAPVRARFGFSDDDIESLRERATAANARWGLDAEHRAPYGLDNLSQGTWRTAVDRMLLGVAMEDDGGWIGDIVPLDDIDSGTIDLIGRFAEFVDRVDGLIRAMEQPRPVTEWTSLLTDATLAVGHPARAWQGAQLRTELEDIALAASDTDVVLGRADFAALVAAQFAGRPTRASFRTGTLTVCTLVPMRSVPHRVVCLVGMDDGAFPRHGVVDGDDVLVRDPAIGERDVRSEDRQLFLDAICAAQEHLVVTYTGADPRSGVEVPPCVPLGELLDAVDLTASAPGGGQGRDHVVVRHPLQPFDERNFVTGELGTATPFSFDPSGLAGARAAAGVRREPVALLSGPLPMTDVSEPVALDDLVTFLVAPMKKFLDQRLHISTWQDDDEPDDALPLDTDGLPEWGIGDRLLRQRLSGTSVDTCRALELRRGDLPPGRLGEQLLTRVGQTVEALLRVCADVRITEPRSVDVAIALDNGREISGTIGGVYGTTLLDVTYSSLGPKQRLQSWVRYLALVAQTDDIGVKAVAVGKSSGDATRSVFRDVDPADARGILEDLVALRDSGLRAPLPMALKTSAVYAERMNDDRGDDIANRAAESRWKGGKYPGENAEPAHALVLGDKAPLSDLTGFDASGDEALRFGPLALRLWRPLLSAEKS